MLRTVKISTSNKDLRHSVDMYQTKHAIGTHLRYVVVRYLFYFLENYFRLIMFIQFG